MGDSITWGYGISNREHNCYPAQLAAMLGTNWEMHNFGVNATTLLHQGDLPYVGQPADTEALAFKPGVVVIDFGANDSKHPGDGSLYAAQAVNNWQYKTNFGFLDMCGFPKDQAYYWKAWWQRSEPLVHIFPHWNWAGKEGQNIPVWCFSNCDEVELFLNGRSLGKKTMPEFRHLQWEEVPYEPGRLEARGYINGQLAAQKVVETTGAPAAIKLMPDRSRLVADGQDTVPIAVAVVDSAGRVVPTADNRISFEVSGAGSNAGVGNGDPSCHEPNQADYRSAFKGYCMVLAQAGQTGGTLSVTARSNGLPDTSVQLMVEEMKNS